LVGSVCSVLHGSLLNCYPEYVLGAVVIQPHACIDGFPDGDHYQLRACVGVGPVAVHVFCEWSRPVSRVVCWWVRCYVGVVYGAERSQFRVQRQ